jgi:hypothetical protein
MNKRIQAIFSSVLILIIVSGAGCGHRHSVEKFLIWRIIKMPNGSERIAYKGVADGWAINTLHEDIACYGTECLNKYSTTPDSPGIRDGLVAVQYTPMLS